MTTRISSGPGRAVRLILCAGAAAGTLCCAGSPPQDRTAAAAKEAAQSVHDQFGPALRLARAARANGDFASAINLYLGVVAIKPADPSILVELGDTLVDAGSMDDAIDVYGKVDAHSAARLGALLGLQQAYLKLAEPEKALQYADQAILMAPLDHRVLVGRGVTLDMLGRHAEAQDAYRAVLRGTPHNVAARNDLALSLAMSGRFEEAVEIMKSMALSSTATPRIRQNLALIYGLAGDAAHAGALSRVDLDAPTAEANLHFFEFARGP
jgi:Flp pilus assembly protein TadD